MTWLDQLGKCWHDGKLYTGGTSYCGILYCGWQQLGHVSGVLLHGGAVSAGGEVYSGAIQSGCNCVSPVGETRYEWCNHPPLPTPEYPYWSTPCTVHLVHASPTPVAAYIPCMRHTSMWVVGHVPSGVVVHMHIGVSVYTHIGMCTTCGTHHLVCVTPSNASLHMACCTHPDIPVGG